MEAAVPAPVFIDPKPITSTSASSPSYAQLEVGICWEDPVDVSCGSQAIGMAMGPGGSLFDSPVPDAPGIAPIGIAFNEV